MKEALRRHHISFQNAFAGLKWAFSTQPNFRIHLGLSALALVGCYYFAVSQLETLVIVFTIVLGLVVEMINTAIESMTDLITTEWRKEAKIAKDVSAGMMLTVAIGALVVAALVFGPRLMGY